MKGYILAVPLILATGCASTSSMFGGSDIQISATEEGMRAYGDHISAIVTNSKAPNDAVDTPAYQLRREQNKTRQFKVMNVKSKGDK